jgi:putative acetyltransferase
MIRRPRPDDDARNLAIWRAAVHATHDFLSVPDMVEIDRQVSRHLPSMISWVAVDEADRPLGFMVLRGAHIGALFVDPQAHGQGVGRSLVEKAAALRRRGLTVDVNEQNPQAIGFYVRLGFAPVGRSPVDDAGRPYPLIHMRRAP